MKKILCLSGGGIKGVAQLEVLVELERQYGKPLCDVYDLILGTSVGAINAAIIATGEISMSELHAQYEDMIRHIFKKRGRFKKTIYSRDNFREIWDRLIEDIKYSEVKTKLMLTTVDVVDDINIFYKSWHKSTEGYSLREIVERSFAAPLYFGQIVDKKLERVYMDGGIGNANFPINEAKLQAESYGWYQDGEEVEIHAVGCLYNQTKPSFKEVSKKRWLRQLMEFMAPKSGGLARIQSLNDQLRMMKYICKHNDAIKFRYWDMPCDNDANKLDGVEFIGYYKDLGRTMAHEPLLSIN